MLSFTEYLVESQEINLAMKAYKQLSYDAQSAIRAYQRSNWHRGELSQAFRENNQLAQEIERVFAPVKEYLHKKYGKTIRLYRGVYMGRYDTINNSYENEKYTDWKTAVLQSWTSQLKNAKNHANMDPIPEPLSIAQIDKMVDQYNRTGFLKYKAYRYVRNKENPKYYWIYRGREMLTDGDDLRSELIDTFRNFYLEKDREQNKRGKILTQDIDIDRIVWITNDLNDKEFIIKAR